MRGEIETLIGDGEMLLRDGLRGARHVLRQGALSLPEKAPLGRGAARLAFKVDGALSRAERTARSLLPPLPAPPRDAGRLVAAFPALLAGPPELFGRGAAETMDRLADTLLHRWGVATAFVSAQEIRAGLRAFEAREAPRLFAARSAGPVSGVRPAAIGIALALIPRHPVRLAVPRPDKAVPDFLAEPNRPVFLAAALALAAFAERDAAGVAPEAFLDAAAAATEARLDVFTACLAAEDPHAALSAAFARVVPALP